MGYTGIFLLMALESSIVPIPSEIIMPPAGYLVQQGQLNMALVILSGTLGSLFGAYLNYFAAHYLGRPFLLKYGRYVLITEEHFRRVKIILPATRNLYVYWPYVTRHSPLDFTASRN